MLFGVPDLVAVEIGEVEQFPKYGLVVQFRFWASNVPLGDWDDRISLEASIENARTVCATEHVRRSRPFGRLSDTEVFQQVYDGFFSFDYTKSPIETPNRRDCFHLDSVGMGAIEDKFGLILVASSTTAERIIVKDLKLERLIVDMPLPIGFVESVLSDYIEWGDAQLREVVTEAK